MGDNPKVRTVDYGSLTVVDAHRILAERGAPAEEGTEFPALYALLAASEGEGIEVRFARSGQEPKARPEDPVAAPKAAAPKAAKPKAKAVK